MELQYSARNISQFSPQEFNLHIGALLVKISIVNGWALPNDEQMLNIYYDQTAKMLVEQYSMLNMLEIEYALRTYGTKVEDWGKSFNLNMLSKALDPYVKHKIEVRKQERKLQEIEVESKKLPVTDTNWMESCETMYQRFITGEYNMSLWPWQSYGEFVKHGFILENEYLLFMEAATQYLKNEDVAMLTKAREESAYGVINHLVKKIESGEVNQDRIIYWAKRMAVCEMFVKAQAEGREHFFVREDQA